MGFIITVITPTLVKSSRNLKVNFVFSEVTLKILFLPLLTTTQSGVLFYVSVVQRGIT